MGRKPLDPEERREKISIRLKKKYLDLLRETESNISAYIEKLIEKEFEKKSMRRK